MYDTWDNVELCRTIYRKFGDLCMVWIAYFGGFPPLYMGGSFGLRFFSRRQSQALLILINSLTPQQARCLELYVYEKLTQEQIAKRLGIGRTTVECYLSRAWARFREIWAEVPSKTPISKVLYEDKLWGIVRQELTKRLSSHL